MQDYMDVSAILVSDAYSDNGRSLELRINSKKRVDLDSEEKEINIIGRIMYINMCGGILSIPPKLPVSIMSGNPIEGIIDTHGYLSTPEDINIVVRHTVPSSIVLDTPNFISINNNHVLFQDLNKYTKIVEYLDIVKEYYDKYLSGLQKPRVITDMDSTRADFSKSKPEELFAYEVSVFGKALYLKSDGIINLYDKDIKIKEKIPKRRRRSKKEITQDKLLNAVIKDDFELAKKALDELKNYENT